MILKDIVKYFQCFIHPIINFLATIPIKYSKVSDDFSMELSFQIYNYLKIQQHQAYLNTENLATYFF